MVGNYIKGLHIVPLTRYLLHGRQVVKVCGRQGVGTVWWTRSTRACGR